MAVCFSGTITLVSLQVRAISGALDELLRTCGDAIYEGREVIRSFCTPQLLFSRWGPPGGWRPAPRESAGRLHGPRAGDLVDSHAAEISQQLQKKEAAACR
jgi:hypothetical protein